MEDFTTELTIKTMVQEKQFEQWFRTFFFLNYNLNNAFEPFYQDLYYIKLHGVLTEGLDYAKDVLEHLNHGKNLHKRKWFNLCVEGIQGVVSELTERELIYIEYRRHNICHIFQNQYEHIQGNYTIKHKRKGKDLTEIDNQLKSLLIEHGNDKNIDEFLRNKLKTKLTKLYEDLKEINDVENSMRATK